VEKELNLPKLEQKAADQTKEVYKQILELHQQGHERTLGTPAQKQLRTVDRRSV
jgi:hypothetical protein